MTRIVFASLADADAAEIASYLEKHAGADVADRYEIDFEAIYRRLERFPGSGAPRPKLGARVRIAVVSPYVLVYEYAEGDDLVTILRLLHGRRKITRVRLIGGRPSLSRPAK